MTASDSATAQPSSAIGSRLSARLRAATDFFLPASREELDADALRRARVALVTIAGVMLCCMLALAWLGANGVGRNLLTVSGLLTVSAGLPFVLKYSGSLTLTGHAICTVIALGLGLLMFDTGAQTFPPFAQLPGIPLVATLIAGTRAGLVWAVLVLAQIALFWFLVGAGLEPRVAMSDEFLEQGRYAAAVFMVVFLTLMAQGYERLKNRALEQLSEERRRQLQLRDRFLSHVSHELRTPLAASHQFLSLVLDGVHGEITPEQRETLDHALRNTNELTGMIGKLVDITRARAGGIHVERGEVCLADIVAACVRTQRPELDRRGITLEVVLPEDLPNAACDARRSQQVLTHLLENAVKFTPAGGHVRIAVSRDSDEEGFVRIRVSDDGCGIDEAGSHALFQPAGAETFQPAGLGEQDPEATAPDAWRSRDGLGFGLAISQELVRLQGGRLWARRRSSTGTHVHFTLPVFDEDAAASQEGRG